MIQLKNCRVGVKEQSLTHSLTHSIIITLQIDPKKRPTFSEIVQSLTQIQKRLLDDDLNNTEKSYIKGSLTKNMFLNFRMKWFIYNINRELYNLI